MNIVIVGLGVIGGSFAMALNSAGYRDVYGVDVDEETLRKAKELGIIKDGSTSGEEFFKNADLIIMSIYPKLVIDFVEKNRGYFKKGSIVTDTTGIKGMFIDKILDLMPEDVEFIFGHPMAGREKKGIDFASSPSISKCKLYNNSSYKK